MNFPFSIANTIILDQREYDISSEKYVLNFIGEHIDEYGMTRKKPSENELFYIKMDPFNLFRKKDVLRNILVRVDCSDSDIKVTLKTGTILLFFVALVAIIFPFFFPSYHTELHILIGIIMILLPYSVKAFVLRSVKKELEVVLEKLKK